MASATRNSQNIPVQYVTRKVIIPLPAADDPATNYNSHDEELVSKNRIVLEGEEGRDANDFENNKRLAGLLKPFLITTRPLIRAKCRSARRAIGPT